VRIEENPAEQSGSNKAVVRFSAETTVKHRDGAPATTADLAIGQRVSAWFNGPIMESYPILSTVGVIIIEAADAP
jgi:hypothetical protein